MPSLREQLIEMEGWKNVAYPDPLTHDEPWTIGVGHTGPEVCKGLVWSDELVGKTLDIDMANALRECVQNFPWFYKLDTVRQAVIANMCFQLGLPRLLKFKKMLAAVRDERYPQAAGEMMNSMWAVQTPKRAHRLSTQMRTGEWS